MTTSLDTSEIRGIPVNANRTLSLSVLSGKGGVGKTTIALNLSLALRREGARVLLVDCDLGLANLDVLLGISPEVTLQDVLISDVSASAAVHRVEDGLDILPAASGVPELVDMTTDMRDMLLSRLRPLLGSYDYVFLDLGAGINGTVQTFADMSMARVLVVTPRCTACAIFSLSSTRRKAGKKKQRPSAACIRPASDFLASNPCCSAAFGRIRKWRRRFAGANRFSSFFRLVMPPGIL